MEEYVRLWKEVKQLVTERKLQIWNEVVDEANSVMKIIINGFWHLLVGQKARRREL